MVCPVLDGKVAIVTGGAMGMGESTARLFAQAGAKVVIADIDEEKGQATTDALRAEGLEVSFVRTDVADAASAEAMVAFAVETYGRLDCAVNNAAMTPRHQVRRRDRRGRVRRRRPR